MGPRYTPAAQLAAEDDADDDRDLGRALDVDPDLRRDRVAIRPLRHQAQALASPTRRVALLGGYGSGKTLGAAWRFVLGCSRNGWSPRYGQSRPRAAVIAPTFRILKQSTVSTLDYVLPRAWVIKRRGPPHNDLLLRNGLVVELHSAVAELEGQSYAGVWCDEIAHHNFDERKFLNIVSRVRDPRAEWLFEVYSGLPLSGWVRDKFDTPVIPPGPDHGGTWSIYAASKDNPHLPEETRAAMKAAVPAGDEETLLGGAWAKPFGAIYQELDEKRHIVERRGDPHAPTCLGVDVGNHGAVVFGQSIEVDVIEPPFGATRRAEGLLVVDQMLPEGRSMEAVCLEIRTKKPWAIVPGRSWIAVDPTMRRDERAALKRHFPGVRIVQRERDEDGYRVDEGIRAVRVALRDALGNARLLFSRSVAGTPLGVLEALARARRNDHGVRVKDDSRDHAEDALRYLVQEALPVRVVGQHRRLGAT